MVRREQRKIESVRRFGCHWLRPRTLMNLAKLLLVLAAAGFAYQYWTKHHQASEATASASSTESRNGFVDLPPVTGANPARVLVIAAEDCPEAAAQRADRLAEQLSQSGIPVTRAHEVSFNIPNASIAQRINTVMNGEPPIVFVGGKAKSNPSLDEVTAEFKAAQLP